MNWIVFVGMMFLVLGALIIVNNQGLYLADYDGLAHFYASYYSWLGSLLSELKGITGAVTGIDWMPSGKDLNKSG